MFTRLAATVALLLINLQPSFESSHNLELLKSHITLAKEGRAYLQLEPGAVLVFVKGVKVERLPVERLLGRAPGTTVSRIVSRVPAVSLPKVVVDSEEVAAAAGQDTLGSVSSADEIVSVNDMPETYMVELSDGSLWYISGDQWEGVGNWSLKKLLQYRVAFLSARQWFTGGQGGLTVFHAEPRIARRLFWLLRDDMGVIH